MNHTSQAYKFETSASVMFPEKSISGLFDSNGKLMLPIKDDRKDKSRLFEPSELSSALRDLKDSAYSITHFTSSSVRAWGVFPTAFQNGGTYTFTGNWSPNALPVSGCYSEWDPSIAKPKWGSANFQLWGIEVSSDGSVRIQGINAFGANLNTAAGLVIPL
jgi:hypothetical protein